MFTDGLSRSRRFDYMVDNRCSLVLNNQEKICINGKEYLIKEEIGRGASCICYTSTSCENGLNYIIKEFYPLTCAKRTVDMKVVAKDGAADEFLQCKKRFEKLYENNLTIQKTHKNLFVEPNYELSGNGYIVMPARDLCTLSEWVADNIPQDSANNTVIDGYLNNALNILHSIAEQLEIYQKNNIIHFDIKPDNIFVFQENNGYFARIIDFDSMMTFSEIEELLDKNQLLKLYSTANCYGEETRASFYAKLKDGFSEKWKQLDVYPLGRLCTFILTGNKIPDIDDFTEDSSFLVSNKSETVNIRKYVFDRFIDKLTAGFGNRYSDAATVKFVVENLQSFMSCYGYFDNQLKYRKDIVPDLLFQTKTYGRADNLSPLENLIKTEHIFDNKDSLLLQAECGMGKSTALRKIYLDGILENQTKFRYAYCPLREFSNEKEARKLSKIVFENIEQKERNNTVILLDAFDESNNEDGGDCRRELVVQINALSETNSVIITSRITVKGLEISNEVLCKSTDFTNSDLLKRIQNNSPWVKNIHGDILSNPFFAIMAEDVANIDDYAMNEKQYGSTCWKLIKSHLLGSIDKNGQLQINYAGELIWNYIYISILTQFKTKENLHSALTGLQNVGKWKYRTSKRWINCLGKQGFFSMTRNGRVPQAQVCGNTAIANIFLQANDNTLNFTKSVIYNMFGWTWIGERNIDEWLETDWNSNLPNNYGFSECEFLSEICGCKYDSNHTLSAFQEIRRYNLQKCVDIFKRYQRGGRSFEAWLKPFFWGNTELRNIDFSGLDLSNIKTFRTLYDCKFDGCKVFINCGNFINCSFENLKEGSFVTQKIVSGYSYCENDNELTKDKKTLVIVRDFDKHTCFAHLSETTIGQITTVIINSFALVKPAKISIPDNIENVEGYKGSLVTDTIMLSGNTKLNNLMCESSLFAKEDLSLSFSSERRYFDLQDIVNNIKANSSFRYFEYKGCLYARIPIEEKNCDNNVYRLLWINQVSQIKFMPTIEVDCNSRIVGKRYCTNVWEKITLPNSVYFTHYMKDYNGMGVFITCLLRNADYVQTIDNLPKTLTVVNGFIIANKKMVLGDLNENKEVLYLPYPILIQSPDLIEKYQKIYVPKNDIHLYEPNYEIIQNGIDEGKQHNDEYVEELNKSYITNHLRDKLIIFEKLSALQRQKIATQQAEWDKYLKQ